MMKINRQTERWYTTISIIYAIISKKGDLLVLTTQRCFLRGYTASVRTQARSLSFCLWSRKEHGLGDSLQTWQKKAKIGTRFVFGGGKLKAEIIDVLEDGNRIARFECEENFFATLDEIGQMPLPPYITEKLKDKDRYQTVYAHELGSSAAPTAGLHFTEQQLEDLKAMGVNIAYVTLHVGLGTFRPVKEDKVLDHKMHREHYELSRETADMINETKKNGGRVIAVGTTSCRTLESVAAFNDGKIVPCDGYTEIFIYPGFEFKVLDGLVTNFHLPESTLIMLVSAFMGYENTMNAYKIAVEEKYRFFSFGDCMLIISE